MKIAIAGFRGETPILDERLLPENAAQTARNVYIKRGTLRPAKAVAAASELPAGTQPANLYHYDVGNNGEGYWFSWGSQYDIDAVRSPIASDQYDRVYWTGQGAPKMSTAQIATGGAGPYPSAWYQLGIPAGQGTPNVIEPSRPEVPATAVETVYVYTFVSEFGEEGPPSNPSIPKVRWDDEEDGYLTVETGAAPSGNTSLLYRRIYRSESGGQYQFVAELPIATLSFQDTVKSEELGFVLQSLEWDAPPAELQGLTTMPGGFLAGFYGNTLCFSEAYRPHAWPISYQLAFEDDIVGIASVTNGLVVGTKGRPWLVNGISPEAMAPMRLDVNQPCVSKRSVVDMGGYAIYAGFDGLVAAGGGEARVITDEVIDREQWQALNPASIKAFRYDGQYLGFYDSGSFVFTPGRGFQFFDEQADAGFYRLDNDTLYLIQGQNIVAWDRGASEPFVWRSKVFEFPPGTASFSCACVIARSYPVTLKILAGGQTVLDQGVTGPDWFRLPPGFAEERDWEIELSGLNEVQSVQIATSPSEIV